MSTAPSVDLPAPVRPSPLIKTARWGFLLAGVLYGLSRNARLTRKENALRESQRIEAEAKAESIAREKARLAKQELDDLAREAGVQPEP